MYIRDITIEDDFKSLWLKKELSKRKITVTQLARAIGVAPQTVSRWVCREWKDSQRIKGIDQISFIAVCSYFGITYDDAIKEWKMIGG